MAATVPYTARAAGYVLLDTLPAALAFPAASVLGIVRGADWHAEPPLPFGDLLPIHFSVSQPAWVLNLAGAGKSIAVTFVGTIRMNYLHLDSLLPMDTFKYNGFGGFSQLVLANGKPLALVVNMDALFSRITK
jgi:hypothetical protein